MAQSAGDVKYTGCFTAERLDSPNECPGYDTKQSDDEAPLIFGEVLGNTQYPFAAIVPKSTLSRSGKTW